MNVILKLRPFFNGMKQKASLVWMTLFLLVYISSFHLSGTAIPPCNLEASWQAVLEYAAKQNFQFGSDILFTYGPLGYLHTTHGKGFLIEQRIVFAFAWSGIVAWSALCVARKISKPSCYAFLAWVLLFSQNNFMAQLVFLVMSYGSVVLMGEVRKRRFEAGAFMLAFALLSLIKFNFMIASVVSVLICSLVQLGKGNIRAAATIASLYVTFFLTCWLITGQHLANLWPWIRGSIEITVGYIDAMNQVRSEFLVLLCAFAAILFLVAVVVRACSMPLTMENSGVLLVTVMYVFLSWKHGLVRADGGHELYFLLFLPIAFALLFIESGTGQMSKKARSFLYLAYAGVIVLCIFAANQSDAGNIRNTVINYPAQLLESATLILKAPGGECSRRYMALRMPSEEEQYLIDRLAIPRNIIGNAPVDVITQLPVIALTNNLNYHPRPVIQSYSAYTPYLQDLNLEFYKSDRRPEYILFVMQTIDHRFPALDDSKSLQYILNNYEMIWYDQDFILLKATIQKNNEPNLARVAEKHIGFGEHLYLNDFGRSAKLMYVDFKPTVLGRIIKFVFQPPVITLHGNTGGYSTKYRIIPAISRQGFLVKPLLRDNDDLITFYQGNWQQIDSIYFSIPRSFVEQYANDITVTLYSID